MSYGDESLDNKTRRTIFNHIIKYPGVSFNTLKDIYELTDSSLRYHVYYLEKNDKISSGLEKGVRCYYPHPASVRTPPKPAAPVESQKLTPEQEQLLNIIIQFPGINQKELIKRSRINRFKVMRNINTLKSSDLIKNTRFQNTVCYEYIPDVEMKYKIMKGLMVKFLKDEIDEGTFIKLKRRLGMDSKIVYDRTPLRSVELNPQPPKEPTVPQQTPIPQIQQIPQLPQLPQLPPAKTHENKSKVSATSPAPTDASPPTKPVTTSQPETSKVITKQDGTTPKIVQEPIPPSGPTVHLPDPTTPSTSTTIQPKPLVAEPIPPTQPEHLSDQDTQLESPLEPEVKETEIKTPETITTKPEQTETQTVPCPICQNQIEINTNPCPQCKTELNW